MPAALDTDAGHRNRERAEGGSADSLTDKSSRCLVLPPSDIQASPFSREWSLKLVLSFGRVSRLIRRDKEKRGLSLIF